LHPSSQLCNYVALVSEILLEGYQQCKKVKVKVKLP